MEDFVNFKLAQKLNEKGYPQHIAEDAYIIDNYGEEKYNIGDRLPIPFVPDYMDDVAAPTIYQVLKWLRDEKKLYVGVTYSPKIEGSQDFYYATIQYIGDYKKTIYPADSYDNWEGAALNGIEYVLDNLI